LRPKLLIAALAVPTGAAAALRIYHLDRGLPGTVYVDAFKFVDEAARMAASGDFAPRHFQYPGLYTNLLAILYALSGAATPYARHLLALTVTALAGVLLVPATYLLARRVCGAAGALLAAGLAAVCPVLLSQSRTPAPDILMALLMTAALYALLAYPPALRSLLAAGAFTGLAMGSKFTGAYLLAWIAAAGWLLAADGERWRWLRSTGLIALVAAASFLLTTPWFLPRLGSYETRLSLELPIQRYGQIGRIQTGYLDYLLSATPTWEQPWLGSSLRANLGLPAVLIGLAALAWGLAGRGGRRVLYLAGYVLLYVVLISGPGHLRAVRFLLPVLPALYVLMGWWLDAVMLRRRSRLRAPIAAAIALLVLAYPATRALRYVAAARLPLTTELAEEWVARSIPAGTKVLLGPFFTDNLRRLPLDAVTLGAPGSRQYRFPEGMGQSPEREPLYSPALLDELRAAGVRYLILNSYFDDALSPVAENLRYFPNSVAAHTAFMERLQRETRLVYTIHGWGDGRLGPDIAVYQLD